MYFILFVKFERFTHILNTRMNNLYVEGFDDYVITEMINM